MDNVYYYIIYYDKLGDPIDVETIRYTITIPAGLARRTSVGVSFDVRDMVTNGGRIEFRILDFEIVE